MRKKQVLLSALLMLMCVNMAHGQTAYVYVQQSGTSLASTLGTASYDVSSNGATLEFDASGNAVMTYNDQPVAELTSAEVTSGGELVGALDGSETKVSKTITTDFATLYSPFQLKVPENAAVTVYTPTLDGSTLKMPASRKLTGAIPPCTPLILYGAANSSITFDYSSEAATAVSDNALSGTAVEIANPTKNGAVDGKLVYTLAHEGGTAGFYKYTGETLGAGKAYLYIDQVQSARGISFSFDDDVTEVDNVNANVDANRDGKYIENGRVVIQKDGKKYNLNGQEVK